MKLDQINLEKIAKLVSLCFTMYFFSYKLMAVIMNRLANTVTSHHQPPSIVQHTRVAVVQQKPKVPGDQINIATCMNHQQYSDKCLASAVRI